MTVLDLHSPPIVLECWEGDMIFFNQLVSPICLHKIYEHSPQENT